MKNRYVDFGQLSFCSNTIFRKTATQALDLYFNFIKLVLFYFQMSPMGTAVVITNAIFKSVI